MLHLARGINPAQFNVKDSCFFMAWSGRHYLKWPIFIILH